MNCFGQKKITDCDTDPLTDSSDFMGPFLPKGKCLGNLTVSQNFLEKSYEYHLNC